MSDNNWYTAISKVEPNKIILRGYSIDELMDNISFAEGVYLAWKGELPSKKVGDLLNAILVSSIDHSVSPPSALATRNASSTGATLSASIASGILAINKFHGGAIEGAMTAIAKVAKLMKDGKKAKDAAAQVIQDYKTAGQRISGFGHRLHKNDPRTKKIFSLARKANLPGNYLEAAEAVVQSLAESGKKLPLNIDGAIAAILLELEFEASFANAFFILSRVVGLTAHALEEKEIGKPMRKIDLAKVSYNGPKERKFNR